MMEARQGWTSSPDSRGTINIIYNCVITSFLGCWSIIIVNVPEPGSSLIQNLFRKLILVGLCVLAPEIIFQVALGQLLQARRGRALFHKSGYSQWTLRHSFYADMGGIHLQTPGWKSFPVDSKQLHYLISRGYVKYPEIGENTIRDKNRVDGMLRTIALLQILWFTADLIARAYQGLVITAMELSTAAFIVMNVAVTLCWLRKPADVENPHYIRSETTIADILRNADDSAPSVYNNTPLDFLSRQEWPWSILWSHGLAILRRLRIAAPPVERPVQRFQMTIVPPIEGIAHLIFIVVSLGYLGIFIAGWNYSFPTEIELLLWRVATVMALTSALAVIVSMHFFFSLHPALCQRIKRAMSSDDATEAATTYSQEHKSTRSRSPIRKLINYLRNNSPLRDPALDAPVGAILVTYICGVAYCLTRTYILVADCIELRSLPESAYQTVNWLEFWPHW